MKRVAILLICLLVSFVGTIRIMAESPTDTITKGKNTKLLNRGNSLNGPIPEPIDPEEPLDPVDPIEPDSIATDNTNNEVPRLSTMGPSLPINNSNKAVGAIGGALSVNNSGAAVYNMQFKCPNGGPLTPQIGLSYNSQQASYGLAGYGFSISGISCITVGEKNRLNNNGSIVGVSYTMDDNLYLDGKRLILLSASKDVDGARYCLEGDPYSKIVQHISTDDGVRRIYFEVFAADGKVYTYGTSLNSFQRIYTDNGDEKVISWYLSSVKDLRGNRVNYL